MSIADYPPIDYVRQCLREENGHLWWLSRPREHFARDQAFNMWNTRYSGNEAGYKVSNYKDSGPRWRVSIDKFKIYRYVLVWAITRNEWVLGLDHENHDSLDDRIDNLRVATSSQNTANKRDQKNNTSGFRGVYWNKANRKWTAQIAVNRRHISLGSFNDPVSAHAAYTEAARKYFGAFAYNGT